MQLLNVPKHSPFAEFFEVNRSILNNSTQSKAACGVTKKTWIPSVDVLNTEQGATLYVDLPGVAKEDIQIEIIDDVLLVSGVTKLSSTSSDSDVGHDKKSEYLIQERRQGDFERKFKLSKDLNQDSIEANYENGLLTLKISKLEMTLPKKIEIN